jgi:hypothetical protein
MPKIKKTETENKKSYDIHNVFTLNKTKQKGALYLKPAFGKYGVKKIEVTLNSGEVVELSKDDALFAWQVKGTTKDGADYSFYNMQLKL